LQAPGDYFANLGGLLYIHSQKQAKAKDPLTFHPLPQEERKIQMKYRQSKDGMGTPEHLVNREHTFCICFRIDSGIKYI
jgi:hypothetical protein